MSRQIDLTKKLSSEDRAYLESRDDQYSLDLNALHLMGGGADEGFIEGHVNIQPSLPGQTGQIESADAGGDDEDEEDTPRRG